jgi:hypothetical protein
MSASSLPLLGRITTGLPGMILSALPRLMTAVDASGATETIRAPMVIFSASAAPVAKGRARSDKRVRMRAILFGGLRFMAFLLILTLR